jgi:hypothetical protein
MRLRRRRNAKREPLTDELEVIDLALGEPKPDKPGIVASVCHACDSVTPEETSRRIHASFGLLETQSGRA